MAKHGALAAWTIQPVILAGLIASGCTADFFLGQDTDGTSTGAPDSASTTTATTTVDSLSETTSLSSVGSSSETAATTEGSSGSTASAEGGTTGTTTTGPDTTTSGPAETTSTTNDPTEGGIGILDCPEVPGALDCEAEAACDWYAELELCFADRCHPDSEIACNELSFRSCPMAPLCFWFGEPELGECGYTPCGELLFGACSESAACLWVGDPEVGECTYRECPACFELAERACVQLDGCAWLDVQATCVAD